MRKIIFIALLLVGCAHTSIFEDPEFKAQDDKITKKWADCIFENIKELSNYSDDIFNIADSAMSSCRKYKTEYSILLRQKLSFQEAEELSQQMEDMRRNGLAVKIAVKYIKRKKEFPFYPTEANGAKWVKLGEDYYIDANSIEKKAEGIFYWSKVINIKPQTDDLKPIDHYIVLDSIDCHKRTTSTYTFIVFFKRQLPEFRVFNPPDEKPAYELELKFFCNKLDER